MARSRGSRQFGSAKELPSGRFQASFPDPSGALTPSGSPKRVNAPRTYSTRARATAWLQQQEDALERGDWVRPGSETEQRVVTVDEYTRVWLETRKLKPRTKDEYGRLLRNHIVPTFGELPVSSVSPALVRAWYSTLAPDKPTARAHAYSLLRTIMNTAVDDEFVSANPCRVRGAGSTPTLVDIEVATPDQVTVLAAGMPARLSIAVNLTAWCALRRGEILELRRKDVDTERGLLHVDRAVVWLGGAIVGTTKTGRKRPVVVPPHLMPAVRAHLEVHVPDGPEAILLTGRDGVTRLHPDSLRRAWKKTKKAADMPSMRFHDLRHTGATWATEAGGSLAEVMDRLGHSTSAAAMRYQHVVDKRQDTLAAALSEMAERSSEPPKS